MRLTVLGGCGGWPAAGLACSGYLVASQAGTGQLVPTHLWPGTDPDESVRAAAGTYRGPIAVAVPGLAAEQAPRGE